MTKHFLDQKNINTKGIKTKKILKFLWIQILTLKCDENLLHNKEIFKKWNIK